MTTPTPHGAPELPELPEHIAHMHSGGDFCLDRVVRAEGWPINVYTAAQMREYARAAIQQAAGAVPAGVLAAAKAANKHWNEFGPLFCFDECMDTLDRALAASPSPLGREAGKEGSSDHLVPCAGGEK